jgi:hypothetical protein
MAPPEQERGFGNGQHLELEAAGWLRRFEAEAIRAGELVDLYHDLGYEVTTATIAAQEIGPDCAGCAIVACQRYVALYTRRPSEGVTSPMTQSREPRGTTLVPTDLSAD